MINFNKKMRIVSIVILIIVLLGNCIWEGNKKQENFNDMLEKIDLMDDKLDSLVDQEKETRTFCKLLRHDSSNKEHIQKVLEQRNIQFNNNWKKQNKMLADIKKKIIDVRLGKNNTDFSKFNDSRNYRREANQKRGKIMDAAKKMIRQKPAINLTIDNNI